MLEYLNVLRENICEAYTGILQGLKNEKPEIFEPYVPQVLEFIHIMAQVLPFANVELWSRDGAQQQCWSVEVCVDSSGKSPHLSPTQHHTIAHPTTPNCRKKETCGHKAF